MMHNSVVMTKETRGQRVRRLRLDRGWSIEQLIREAKIARPTLERIEADEPVRQDSIEAVAAALDTTLEYLVTGIDPARDGGWATPEVALRATTTLSDDHIETLVRLIAALQEQNEHRDTA